MDKKLISKNRDNTIYLSENDARALGIVEGDTQSIFIDGQKVELEFIDEHEIFDATDEERRILNNALNLRKREIAEKLGVVDPSTRTSYLVPYGTIEDDTPNFDNYQVSTRGKGFFGTLKTLFGKRHKPNETPVADVLERSKYRNRTDIFTNDEIRIIQEVISRTQGNSISRRPSYYDDSYNVEEVVVRKPRKTKKSSTKKAKPTTTKKTQIKKAKGHELSRLNFDKAARDLKNDKVTSPKKKQARRAARRTQNKK